MNRTCSAALVGILLGTIMLGACSTSTPASPPQEAARPAPKKEPVLYTGKSCMSQMAGMAGRWAADALPYHMESSLNAESDGHDGKSTVWRAMFASQSRRTYRVFTCSGSRLPDAAPAGVSATPEAAYSPNVPVLMFQPFLLHSDTDQVYKLAQDKGGAKLLEKNPKQPVIYLLDWDSRNKQLLWVVVYGESSKEAKGRGVIDATTGNFLRAG